eukprot:364795-Chlamydomonas_euryale.AAC.22
MSCQQAFTLGRGALAGKGGLSPPPTPPPTPDHCGSGGTTGHHPSAVGTTKAVDTANRQAGRHHQAVLHDITGHTIIRLFCTTSLATPTSGCFARHHWPHHAWRRLTCDTT